MANENQEMRDLWQGQDTNGFRMSTEEIRRTMEELEKKLGRRTRLGMLVSWSLIAMFALWSLAAKNAIQQTGALLTVAGVAYLAYQLRQNRFRGAPAEALGTTASADYLRAELERQRDFHRGKTFWTRLLILIPGPLVFFAGFAKAHPEVIGMIRFEVITFVILTLAAIPVNLRLARGYQRQIDELDTMRGEAS